MADPAPPRARRERDRAIAFLVLSGFAALVNLGARAAINLVTSYVVAIVLAYLIAMTTAFLLNRRFVFDSDHGSWQAQYVRFGIVNLVAIVQVVGISLLFDRAIFPALDFTWNAATIAHGIGVVSPAFTSYWAHKHFSFARPGAAKGAVGS